MTEALFHLTVYLVIGGLLSLYFRLVGIPELGHKHQSKCYDDASLISIYEVTGLHRWVPGKNAKRICRPWLGGTSFQFGLWIVWTTLWPVVIIGLVISTAAWVFLKFLELLGKIVSVKF